MFSITILGILLFSVLTGCGQIQKYEIPYTADSEVSSFRVIEFTNEKNTADPFAKDLCVSESNYRADAIDLSNASGGALFDVNNHETIYAKNIYEKFIFTGFLGGHPYMPDGSDTLLAMRQIDSERDG